MLKLKTRELFASTSGTDRFPFDAPKVQEEDVGSVPYVEAVAA